MASTPEIRQISKNAYRLARKLFNEAHNTNDLIEATLLLTTLVHAVILDTEGAEATKRFLDQWIEMVKHDVEQLITLNREQEK